MKFNIQRLTKSPYRYPFILLIAVVFTIVSYPGKATAQVQTPHKEADEKPIKLSAARLAMFAGKYRYMDSYVTVSPTKDGILLKQLDGQRAEISFYPTDLHEFHTNYFGKAYWIMFSGSSKQKAPSFVTIDHDIWMRVK